MTQDHSPTDLSLEPKLEILGQLVAVRAGADGPWVWHGVDPNVSKIHELLENSRFDRLTGLRHDRAIHGIELALDVGIRISTHIYKNFLHQRLKISIILTIDHVARARLDLQNDCLVELLSVEIREKAPSSGVGRYLVAITRWRHKKIDHL